MIGALRDTWDAAHDATLGAVVRAYDSGALFRHLVDAGVPMSMADCLSRHYSEAVSVAVDVDDRMYNATVEAAMESVRDR